jgi:hypothetical protein
MKTRRFDERQRQIRGEAFFHGFIAALALIMLNGFLQDGGIVWAGPLDQSLLISMAAVMAVTIELLLRGAYFGQQKGLWLQIGLFGAVSVLLTYSCLRDLMRGAALVENSRLSGRGVTLIFDGMFVAMMLVGLIKAAAERRKNRE